MIFRSSSFHVAERVIARIAARPPGEIRPL
jgi:hypothetical protein